MSTLPGAETPERFDRSTAADSSVGAVLASLLFACLLSAAAFPDVWASMVRIWSNSETFAHGFIVLPCAAWMLWHRRSDWRALPLQTWWPATIALAGCGAVWLVGRLGGVASIEQFGAVAVIPATMLLLVGPAITRAIAFPLAFLFFAVPVGEFLTPIMMDYTADATVAAIRWSGVPVFREGLHFALPSGRWSVVEACSGLRYLIASLALGVLYAYLQFRTLRYRLAFVALAIVVPVIANWIRAYGIVMLGHLSDMRVATGVDHLVYGWLFFGLVMALLFWIGSRWREPDPVRDETWKAIAAASATDSDPSPSPWSRSHFVVALVAMALVVLWRPVSSALLDQSEAMDGVGPLRAAIEGFPPADPLDYQPHFVNADGVLRVARSIRDVAVEVHAFHYARQHESGEMVHGNNYVVRADDFRSQVISQAIHRTTWGTVAAYRIRRQGAGTLLVWQWYAVGDTQTASAYRTKAATAWSLLTGHGDNSLAMVIVTPIEIGDGATPVEQRKAATQRLETVANSLQPAVHAILQAPATQ